MRRVFLVVVCAAAVVAGCGRPSSVAPPSNVPSDVGAGPEILPLLINAEIVKGPNRFLFSLTDRQNRLVAAPDVSVQLRFYDVDASENNVVFDAEARFLWAIEDRQGLYVASVAFPDAGRWGTRFDATFPDGTVRSVRADYDVAESGSTPALGARVARVDTPTLADAAGDVKRISTDSDPELRFYRVSIADALAAGEPFVVVFATPAFCESRLCGPTLETAKAVARDYPEITFINVEPYRMVIRSGSLQPDLDADGRPQPAEWTSAWGLRSEPYTFVIGADGTVLAKFEGVMGEDELRTALEAL